MVWVSAFAIASVALLAYVTPSASAAEVHVYSHSFGAGELSLTAQSGIAVDQETDDLYVADTKHSRIAKFTGSAGPASNLATATDPTSIAVDNSTGPSKGDIYVVEGEGTVSKLDPNGALITSWGTGGHLTGLSEILGIAVDPVGNLWVLSQTLTPNVIDTLTARTYNQAGVLVTSPWSWSNGFGNERRAAPTGIAVDSADAIYSMVGFYNPSQPGVTVNPKVQKFGAAGETLLERLNSFESAGIATEPSVDDVYLGRDEGRLPPNLFRYSSAGVLLETFGGGYEGPVNQPVSEAELDRLQSVASMATAPSGSLDVADWMGGQISEYNLEEVESPSVTIEPPGAVTQTTAHVVGHIDPHAPAGSPTSHDVAWHLRCTPGCPSQEKVGQSTILKPDGSVQPVEVTIEELVPGTKYTVTLIAESRGGPPVEVTTESFSTAAAPPTVTDEAASEVFRGEATLNAQINPNGADTTYHFEYITKVAFEEEGGFVGAQVQRTPESEPFAGQPPIAHQISIRVGGLESATEYVYRAVARNLLGTKDGAPVFFRSQVGPSPVESDCPNQTLRLGIGERLPDCRAYELVSPTEKQGSPVEPYESSLQTSLTGNAVTWFTGGSASDVPSPGQAGHQDPSLYLSTTNRSGWTSQRLLPPESKGERGRFLGLTEDGRFAMLASSKRDNSDPALFLLDTADQELTTIVPPLGTAAGRRAFTYDGCNEADTLFFFESRLQLPTKVAGTVGKNNLYMWNRETGELSLVGILPGVKNETPAGGSFGGAYSWFPGKSNPAAGGSEAGLYVGALHAISSSGDAVYFTSGAGTGASDQLYLRRGLTGAKPSTVRISAANAGVTDLNGEQPAAFQEATPNGEKVFFLSSGKLTQNANTGVSDEGSDLYRYDVGTKTLVDVTPDPVGAGARVQGLLGAAEDGRSGYLAAQGVLAPGGVEGKDNLYQFEEASSGSFSYRFVAALRPDTGEAGEGRNWTPISQSSKTARVSADGKTLLFMSSLPLNGEQLGSCIYGLCNEVYRYSVDEGPPACVSCNPSARGLPMIGAELSVELSPTLVPEGVPVYGSLPRNLSASGTRVFFQSAEALLPEDKNGQNCTTPQHCVDVYEWEMVGTGSCRAANQAGGCLYLLSTGESDQSSYFVGASSGGDDAFMITSSQLVPVDEDGLADIYDVRVDGGLPSQHVQTPEPCNSAEACKGASASSLPLTIPGTQTFQGQGNPKPRCTKGAGRKRGKCVKKSKHKKKHHKTKIQKKKHHKRRPSGIKRSEGKSK